MKRLALILVLVSLSLAAADESSASSTSEDATSLAKLAKTYIEASKLKTDAQLAREEIARNALKNARKERKVQKMEYLRKEKDIKLKELMEKSAQMDKEKLLERINSYDNEVLEIAAKLAKKTAVQVPTVAGAEVVVSLAALNNVVSSEEASVKITTNKGLTVDIPTLAGREIAVKASNKIVRKAENLAMQNLMREATLNPGASDKLIKMLFKKIYANDAARAKQKAFARVEAMMKLPEGSLYKQYMDGVEEPSIKVAKSYAAYNNKPVATTKASETANLFAKPDVNDKDAQILATYDIINSMDLSEEKEIPDALLNVLNKDLRNKAAEEEEKKDESKLAKLRTYLFGRFD